VVTENLLNEEAAPETMEFDYNGEKVTLTLSESTFEEMKISLGSAPVTATYELHDGDTAPETMNAEYTDPETGVTVTVTLEESKREQTGRNRKPLLQTSRSTAMIHPTTYLVEWRFPTRRGAFLRLPDTKAYF